MAHTPLGRGDGYAGELNLLKDEVINEISAKHGKTPAQVVIKYNLQRRVGVYPKTSSIARLQENWESWNFELTEDDMKKIRGITKKLRIADGVNIFKHYKVFDFWWELAIILLYSNINNNS